MLGTKCGARRGSGLSADVDVQIAEHADVALVPSQAVLGRPVDDLPSDVRKDNPNVDETKTVATVVYRFIDDKAVVTPVTIGPSDVTHTAVVAGLDLGDQIIVGPYKVLENLKHEQAVGDEEGG